VLLARVFAGAARGKSFPEAQKAFQLGGDNPGDVGLFVESQNVYLRGYPINAFRGRKAGLASLEYRFPISDREHGWDSRPLFVKKVHGAIFAEAGNAWDLAFHGPELKRSVGCELKMDLVVAYVVPITWKAGIAQGLDEEGKSTFVFGLWMPLEL